MAIAFNEEDELLGDVYDMALARRMLRYVRPYRRSVIVAVVLLIGIAGLELVGLVSGEWCAVMLDAHRFAAEPGVYAVL